MVAQLLNNLPAIVFIEGVTFEMRITQYSGDKGLIFGYFIESVESGSKHFDEWFKSGKWVNRYDNSYKQRYLIKVTQIRTDSDLTRTIYNLYDFLKTIGLVKGPMNLKKASSYLSKKQIRAKV